MTEYENGHENEHENGHENTNESARNIPHVGDFIPSDTPAPENKYIYSVGISAAPPDTQPPTAKAKKKHPWVAIVAVALCCSLLGSIMGAGGVLFAQKLMDGRHVSETANRPEEKPQQGKEPQQDKETMGTSGTAQDNVSHILQGKRENSVIDTVTIDTDRQMTPAEVYAANVNSTVGITTSITTNYWGMQSTTAASGSGFVISDDGYILTNYHVVDDSSSISVSTYNGESYDAVLIGYDEDNDIAVLKVNAEGLVPVILGDSDNLNVGDKVVAIGNPLGELTFSLTYGAISAKDREVTFSDNVTMVLLQTDCAINSGNSGGALFNLYGEVIGVTNAKYSGASGSNISIDNIGFAIPINSIISIVENIIERGYISKPYIGISVLDVSAESQQFGVPAGAGVQTVYENTSASRAGLKKGDVITAVDGTSVTSSSLVDLIAATSVGDTLVFSIYRQGETLELTITVGEQIQSAIAEEEQSQQQTQQSYPGAFPWGSTGRP